MAAAAHYIRQAARLTLLALAMLAVIASGLLFWLQSDNHNLEITLEWALSKWLQRELQIGELLEADLGSTTHLVATDVRLANPDWAQQGDFVRAERLDLAIDIGSLWREGPVVIPSLAIGGAELNLSRQYPARGNWVFWPDRAARPVADDAPLPVWIEQGTAHSSRIRYQDEDQDIDARIDSLNISQKTPDGLLDLSVEGRIDGEDLVLTGRAGPPRALFNGKALRLDVALDWGEFELLLTGGAADLKQLQGVALQVNANTPRSGPLLRVLGIAELRDGPLQLTGTIKADGSRPRIDFDGRLDTFAVAVKGELVSSEDFDLAFDLRGPSLREAGAVAEFHTLPDVPYEISGKLKRDITGLHLGDALFRAAQSRISGDGMLPDFPRIDDWQLQLQGQGINLALLGPLLGLQDMPDQPYDVSGTFSADDNGVELLDVELRSGRSRLSLEGIVGQAPSHFGTRLQLELTGDDMSEAAPWVGLQQMPAHPFALSGTMSLSEAGWQLANGQLDSPTLSMALEGQMDRLINASRIDAHLQVTAADLANTLAAYGVATETGKGLTLKFDGNLRGTAEQMQVDDASMALGKTLMTLNGQLGGLQDVEAVSLAISLDSPNLRELLTAELPGSSPLPANLNADLSMRKNDLRVENVRGSLAGGARLSGNMRLGTTESPAALDAEFKLQGDSSHALVALFTKTGTLGDSRYELSARVQGDSGRYRAAPLQLVMGKSDVSGSVDFHSGDVPRFNAKLHSQHLHLPFLVPSLEERQADQAAASGATDDTEDFTDELTEAELRERIISSTPFDLAWLRDFNAGLQYSVDEMFVRENVSSEAALSLELNAGVLQAAPVSWRGTFSAGTAALSLDASADNYSLQAWVDGERFPLLWLLAGEPDYASDAMFKARFAANGNTAKAMAGNLDGAVIFRGEGGRLSNAGMDLIVGDLLNEILDSLNPTTQRRAYTQVECNAGALEINDGVMAAIPGFILRTDKTDFLAAGMVDLNSEKLDMTFSTRSRKGLGISAGRTLSKYVKLGGTLANPRLTLDARGAAVTGGAAVATAGWSILATGMWDRWVATAGDPCKRLIKQARQDEQRTYRALLRGTAFTVPPNSAPTSG